MFYISTSGGIRNHIQYILNISALPFSAHWQISMIWLTIHFYAGLPLPDCFTWRRIIDTLYSRSAPGESYIPYRRDQPSDLMGVSDSSYKKPILSALILREGEWACWLREKDSNFRYSAYETEQEPLLSTPQFV